MALSKESAQGSDEVDEMYCELCKTKGRSRPAEGFCCDCVEYFCSVCVDYHSYFYPSHDQKDKFTMPQDFCLKPCSAHIDKIIKFYCPSCKQFFCSLCKEKTHLKCSGVSHLPMFVQSFDLKEKVRATCKILEKTLETVCKREGHNNENITSIKSFSTKAKTAVDRQAKIVKDWVDASSLKLKQEISKLESDDEAKLMSETTKLNTLKSEVDSLKTDINNKEKSGKRCELFMSLTTAEEAAITDRVSRMLQTEVTEYNFEASTKLLDILKDQSLGSIERASNCDEINRCVICLDMMEDPKTLECGHSFCTACLDKYHKNSCPTCGKLRGKVLGDQPDGKMEVRYSSQDCFGFPGMGKIHIIYSFPSGRQQAYHPNPGMFYKGIVRTGYLPNNNKGKQVLKMLQLAFDRKLVFTIGRSMTTGEEGVITWNGISHKTDPRPNSQFGYPDSGYLDRVIEELSAKGITPEDVSET